VLEPLSDGGVRLQLSHDERALLVGLTGELRAQLEVTPEDPSLRRLFPHAYDDDADEPRSDLGQSARPRLGWRERHGMWHRRSCQPRTPTGIRFERL